MYCQGSVDLDQRETPPSLLINLKYYVSWSSMSIEILGTRILENAMTNDSDPKSAMKTQLQPRGIGFGLFLLLTGLVLLAERLGWLPTGADWLFPVILIAWGTSELYRSQQQ
jgi:hypothetical protein